MTCYRGGDKTRGGAYFDRDHWDIVTVGKKHGILPGNRESRYLRLPIFVLAILGPLMGALYVIVLPVFGIGMTFALGIRKLFIVLLDAIAPIGTQREEAPK